MLSTLQKADILTRAGIAVPALPQTHPPAPELPTKWRQAVENLYATYVAQRAARSLREAESTRTLADLREANLRMTHTDDHDED